MNSQFAQNKYFEIIKSYIADSHERHLVAAAELGRMLVEANIPTEEIAELHAQALHRLAQISPDLKLLDAAYLISTPLMELLMAYGLAFRQQVECCKQAVQKLKQSEKKYRKLFEDSKDAIFISTPDGKLLDINAAGIQLFGYASKKEIKKTNIAKDFYFDVQTREAYKRTIERQGFVKDYELVLKRKDGQKLFVLESATAIRNDQGKVVAYQGIIHDLTERKQLEEELLQAQKMEIIGTLAGGVAHDFNNLLTVILGNAEFGMQESKPNDAVYKDLLRIEKAAIQARDLTSQLLSFSRRQVLNPKLLDLNKIIEDLLKMLKRILGENIELKTELAPKLPPVLADPSQVQQVLMNLCINARDAMPHGGKLILKSRNFIANHDFPAPSITYRAEHTFKMDQVKELQGLIKNSRNYVEITITDTGIGMDKETQARIFEPYFTTKKMGKGTGLGLSVVYGIVKQHKGHIEVFSEKDKGTSFKIYFPAITEPKSADQEQKIVPLVQGGNETILVVEDDISVRNVTVRILKGLGYSVLTAKNGIEAIAVFEGEGEKIDLVIMDVVMPKSGGLETYKKMRSINSEFSILFVTGYDLRAELDELSHFEQQQVRVLRKPYNQETLGKTVRELLDL